MDAEYISSNPLQAVIYPSPPLNDFRITDHIACFADGPRSLYAPTTSLGLRQIEPPVCSAVYYQGAFYVSFKTVILLFLVFGI